MSKNDHVAYVCGPLTELLPDERNRTKKFYERIADVCETVLGMRAFVPHEHFDPISRPDPTPYEVDEKERHQVCVCTSHLIVVPLAPSWGGGIEVEMAYRNGVPVILLCDEKRLRAKQISRLLRGNPGVRSEISYTNEEDALSQLASVLQDM